KGEERGTAPLSWGYPHLAGPEHHGNKAKVSRVKEVLTAPAYDELADNREDGSEHGEGEGIGTQEQAQGEARDEGTAWIVGRELPQPSTERLGQQHGGQDHHRLRPRHREIEPDDTIAQQP